MSTDPDTDTDSETRTDFGPDIDPDQPLPTEPSDDRPLIELRSVVVGYDQRPDRRTVYQSGLSSAERMSEWLTADDDTFVDLETVR